MSLAEFYSRDQLQKRPISTTKVVIDFCTKTEGVISWDNEQSIFGKSFDKPSCCAVYTAKSGQDGFDMVIFERKLKGGYIAIFVEIKSDPNSKTRLGFKEVQEKRSLCLAWSKHSRACKELGIGSEDCFLVVASWRHGDPVRVQGVEALDSQSHILILGREDLTLLYTPTLVSRLHFITGNKLVRVE